MAKRIILTFDDACLSHREYVAPLLREYGFTATFYISEYPGSFEDKTQYMTWEQIKELQDMGFEVANHSLTHKIVTEISEKEMEAEVADLEERFKQYGLSPATTYAYPVYAYDDAAIKVLAARGYKIARTGGNDKPYNYRQDDPMAIPSYNAHGADRETVLKYMDAATDENIVILTFHGVPDIDHPHVSTERALFEEYMDYIKLKDFEVIAMKDILSLIAP